MILVDTNIFLEILLKQEKYKICQTFLNANIFDIAISDFSLYSIGIILFKYKQPKIYQDFLSTVTPSVSVISLSPNQLFEVIRASSEFNIDFDDAYQLALARVNQFSLATLDKHFKKVRAEVNVIFPS